MQALRQAHQVLSRACPTLLLSSSPSRPTHFSRQPIMSYVIDYETHYGEPPALPAGTEIRLLSMEFCPFAERSRIALAHKQLPHDIINCDLKDKPAILLKTNPNASVPVLLHKGAEIYESEVTLEYLDGVFPQHPLYPNDPLKRAQGRLLSSNQGSKIIPLFYKATNAKKRGLDEDEAIAELHAALQKWVEGPLAASEGPFFLGKEVTAVDFLIWPWLQRLDRLNKKHLPNLKLAEKFPKLTAWIAKLRELPAIKATEVSEENFGKFVDAIKAGQPTPYNVGSKHPIYATHKE